jgi:hypothetical protein
MLERIEIQNLSKDLAPATDSSLAPVDKIHINLLTQLDSFLKEAKHAQDKKTLIRLIKKIRWGARIHENEVPLFQNELIQQKIKHQIRMTNNQYEVYCTNTYNAFKQILTNYQHNQHRTGFFNFFRRYRNGYSYQGPFKKYKHFILLIDRIALIDTSGKWITFLLKKLDDFNNKDFHHANQMFFLNDVYAIFQTWQDEYYINRQREDRILKKRLIQAYRIPDNYHNWLHQYFDCIVYNKDIDLIMPYDFPIGKITYDLKQIRDAISEQNTFFAEQSKALKKDIHHIAQELGLPSQIKKKEKTHRVSSDLKEENDQQEYQSCYYVEQDLTQCKDIIPAAQKNKRKIKARNSTIAGIGAGTSSIGEAAVSIVGILGATSLFPAYAVIAVVGFSAWYINRLLFKNDSEDCLNAMFLKKQISINGVLEEHRLIFLDKNNQPISKTKKMLICTLGALTFFTGLVSAALNFVDTLKLILFSHQTAFVALAAAGASVPALGLLIGFSCILFKVVADFIRYDRHKEIKEYVYKTFIDVPWKEMTAGERAKHIGTCVAKTAVCLTALAITAIVTIASFGVFYDATLKTFKYVANASVSGIIAKMSSWINSLITLPFQIDHSNKVLQSLVFNKRHTFSKVLDKKPAKTLETNALQKQASRLRKVEKAIAVTTNIFNGLGQACVNGTNHTILSHNKSQNKTISTSSAFFYSALPNAKAAIASIELSTVMPHDSKQSQLKTQHQEDARQNTFKRQKTWRFFNEKPVSNQTFSELSQPSLSHHSTCN